MSGFHPDIGPELRQLAQAILERLDPAVRLLAARAAGTGDGPGRCEQVWCPVCALGALVSGEEHPLLNVISEHSVALLTVVRAMVDDIGSPPEPEQPPPAGPPSAPPEPGRFQHIPVTLEE